jgi:uncharacterized Zn finger protein (UPF0148 family)
MNTCDCGEEIEDGVCEACTCGEFCPECGVEVFEGETQCPDCGNYVGDEWWEELYEDGESEIEWDDCEVII